MIDASEEAMARTDGTPAEFPIPPRPWKYGERLVRALEVAALMHATQERKKTSIPYIAHLLGTCAITLEYGATEDEAIAALLHDAIEDVTPTAEARAAVWGFGPVVGRIVEACTDADSHPKPPWRARKEAYLARLGHEDHGALLVSASDKLHNCRAIVADLRRHGPSVWERFTPTKDETVWYYRALVGALRANPVHPVDLVDELDRTVTEMERLAGDGG